MLWRGWKGGGGRRLSAERQGARVRCAVCRGRGADRKACVRLAREGEEGRRACVFACVGSACAGTSAGTSATCRASAWRTSRAARPRWPPPARRTPRCCGARCAPLGWAAASFMMSLRRSGEEGAGQRRPAALTVPAAVCSCRRCTQARLGGDAAAAGQEGGRLALKAAAAQVTRRWHTCFPAFRSAQLPCRLLCIMTA